MAEINDAELLELRQAHGLLKALYADGAVGIDFKKLVKRKFPQASIPDLEAVVKVDELGGTLGKKFDELSKGITEKVDGFLNARTKERQDEDVAVFAAKIDKISKDRGYTEEGQKKLLELMKERNIANPEDAAIIFEARQPKTPAKPRAFSSRMAFVSPDGKDDASFKALMDDPEQWMMDEMYTALGENNQES